jgi:Holliday junction DNA helicase RuvA
MPVERFINAVRDEDVSLLSTIPGLGSKTAARIVLELKGKLKPFSPEGSGSPREGQAADDAVSALVNLGYRKAVSEGAVSRAIKKGHSSLEDIIKETLKSFTEK